MTKREAEYNQLMGLSRHEVDTIRNLCKKFGIDVSKVLVYLKKEYPGASHHDGTILTKTHLKKLKPLLVASLSDPKGRSDSSIRRLPQIDWNSRDGLVRRRRDRKQREIEKWYKKNKENGGVRLSGFLQVVKYGEIPVTIVAKCLGIGDLDANSILNLQQYKKLADYLPIYGNEYVTNNKKWINEILAGHPHY